MNPLNAEANPISMASREEMNKNTCGVGGHTNFTFITIL